MKTIADTLNWTLEFYEKDNGIISKTPTMKTTKTYPVICVSCKGSGFINDPYLLSTTATIVCPVCNGNKVITVTETTE